MNYTMIKSTLKSSLEDSSFDFENAFDLLYEGKKADKETQELLDILNDSQQQWKTVMTGVSILLKRPDSTEEENNPKTLMTQASTDAGIEGDQIEIFNTTLTQIKEFNMLI